FSLCACACTASALTMKMITITRKTSVSGVMLMSANRPPTLSPSSLTAASSDSGSFPIAIAFASRLRALVVASPAGLARRRGLGQLLEELVGQELELGRDAAGPLVEEVEEDHGLDGDEDAGGGRDQRLRDRARHHVELDALLALEAAHRGHDADHGAEQTDERRGRADGAEDPQAGAQVLVDALALAVHGG